MAEETIRITGLRECIRAINGLDKTVKTELKGELKRLAEPVAASARGLVAQFEGASVSTIRPRAGVRGAFVTQGARKVTGQRGDFGALQMRRALLPALAQHESTIKAGVDLWIAHVIATEGL